MKDEQKIRKEYNIHIYNIYKLYQIYVKNGIYRPHLAKKINLRQFRMEIDQKNGSILTIILPGRFEKHINSIKIHHFFRTIFLKNVFFQIHFTYRSGRVSGRMIDHPYG